MRRVFYFAMVLAFGCKADRDDETTNREAAKSTPTAASETASATQPRPAVPWSPRNEDAQFFSRPAENWDQKPLELAGATFEVTVKDGIAAAVLDVQVTNPTAGQAEAVIALPIPPGAAVTGATLWMGEEPMAGVMLGSAEARQIYDAIVNRRRDPLLVAWAGSDMLSLSIFPLEAKQTRRVQVTWVEPTVADRQWVPSFYNQGELVGSPERVVVNGAAAKPDGNWVKAPRTTPVAEGDFRLRIQEATRPTAVAVILDTSAESAGQRSETWKEVESFVAALGTQVGTTILAADWVIHELAAKPGAAELDAAKSRLATLQSAGLFDQRQAVTEAEKMVGPAGAIAVFASQLPANPAQAEITAPVYWVSANPWLTEGDIVDRSGGRWVKSGAELAEIVRPMVRPSEPGFEWLPLEAATGHLVWMGYKKGAKVDSEAAATPVEALFYRAMLRRAEIPLNKIVSPRTSILVLESEAHYKRWGVKDQDGKLVRDRTGSPATISELLEQGKSYWQGRGGFGNGGGGSGWGTIGAGRYGTIGHGGGTGAGYGTGGRVVDARVAVPRIRIGNAEVRGDLDKNIIRRYIRRKLPRIKYCYEQELLRHEQLQGRATAEFTITAEGKVLAVKVSMDHPDGKATAKCIEKIIADIVFPKPKGGGLVMVKYPFDLQPAPASLWAKARKLQLEAKPGYEKQIGALFGYAGEPNRVDLAWWLVENRLRDYRTPTSAYQTVTDLLRTGAATDRDKEDARRILSEALLRYADIAITIFEDWGLPEDAERARNLWPQRTARQRGFGPIGGTGSGF